MRVSFPRSCFYISNTQHTKFIRIIAAIPAMTNNGIGRQTHFIVSLGGSDTSFPEFVPEITKGVVSFCT
jgi:hypothetical protein